LTRVLVVAQSAVARAGLEAVLKSAGTIEVIGSVADWAAYSGEAPDVIVIDGEMDAEHFQRDDVPVVLLSDGVLALAEVMRWGVRAVLPKEASERRIVAAVEAVAAGLVVLQASDVEALPASPRHSTMAEPLTPREIEVLGMLAEGLSNKLIAHRMGISEHTVKFHIASIMAKLNAGSRTEAVMLGIRQGLIMI